MTFDSTATSAAEVPEAIAPSLSLEVEVRRNWLRIWGARSVLSLVDQGFTSAASFVVNLLLARWLPANVYGAFAVAFAAFLFLSGFHNVLLLEPLSVFGPSRYSDNLPAYFRAHVVVHTVLVGILSVIMLVAGALFFWRDPHNPLGGAVMGSALALPFVLLLWAARRMCYVVQRPSIAVVGSLFYFVVVVAGLVLLSKTSYLSPFCAFLLTGVSSLGGAMLLLSRLGVLVAQDSGTKVPWRPTLREDWTYGRWLVASTMLYSASTQSQTFLTGGLLGLGAAGALRAMQLPALAMSQVVTATGLLVLPAMSYDFGRNRIDFLRRKAAIVSKGLVVLGLAVAGVLAISAPRIEHLLFAGRYASHAWLMPVLALVPLFAGLATGYSMALRAAQQPKFDLFTNAVAAPVSLLVTLFFMRIWGVAGAAVGMVASFVLYAGSYMWYFHGWIKDSQTTEGRKVLGERIS